MIRVEELIQMAGEFAAIDEGLTVNRIVQDEFGTWYKIRGYATEDEAKEKELFLQRLAGIVEFPKLIGRWQNFLVFRFISLQDDSAQPGNEFFYHHLGRFIAAINQFEWEDQRAEKFEQEFASWLTRLEKMRLIPPWIARRCNDYYREIYPLGLPVRLDYWDAMPHNFAIYQGHFTLLDEKHLRPSFMGVGLVKPSLLLDACAWKKFSEGYEKLAPLNFFYEFKPFLLFYYLVAALYFYSLTSAAGRVSLAANQRYLDYRDRLIAIVSPPDGYTQIKNELHLYATFPRHITSLLRRRLVKWSRRK